MGAADGGIAREPDHQHRACWPFEIDSSSEAWDLNRSIFQIVLRSQTSADLAYDGHAISIGNRALRIRKCSPGIAFRLYVHLHCRGTAGKILHFSLYHQNEFGRRLGGLTHGAGLPLACVLGNADAPPVFCRECSGVHSRAKDSGLTLGR